jgi:hypothetical protein
LAATAWIDYGGYWLAKTQEELDERALEPLERSVEWSRLISERDPSPQNLMLKSAVLNNMSGARRRSGAFDKATALLAEAQTTLETLVSAYPSTLRFQLELVAVRSA